MDRLRDCCAGTHLRRHVGASAKRARGGGM